MKDRWTYRARSAITGRWVTMWEAFKHPKTTIIERRKK